MHIELKKQKNKAKTFIPDMRKAILDEVSSICMFVC